MENDWNCVALECGVVFSANELIFSWISVFRLLHSIEKSVNKIWLSKLIFELISMNDIWSDIDDIHLISRYVCNEIEFIDHVSRECNIPFGVIWIIVEANEFTLKSHLWIEIDNNNHKIT